MSVLWIFFESAASDVFLLLLIKRPRLESKGAPFPPNSSLSFGPPTPPPSYKLTLSTSSWPDSAGA